VPERLALELTFPRVLGYRYLMPAERLQARFGAGSKMSLSTREIPTLVELDPVVGKTAIHDLEELRSRRLQEVSFRIAKLTLDEHFRDEEGNTKPWLYPQLVTITEAWMRDCVTCKDDAFPQMLLLSDLSHAAADRIHRAIMQGTSGEKRLLPILMPYDPLGSTRLVAFDTIKEVWETDPHKCHLNYVALDSGWEAKLAQTLETMPEVECYVKNQGLNFAIPYTLEGQSANYWPDYIVRVPGEHGPLNLIVEVSGRAKKDKAAKVATARHLWVPAINNHSGFGRWDFIEVRDPWDAANKIRKLLNASTSRRTRS
jgi:type III restriction enzyme